MSVPGPSSSEPASHASAAPASDPFVVPRQPGPPKYKGKVARYDGCSMRDWDRMLVVKAREQAAAGKPPGPPVLAAMRHIGEREVRSHDQKSDMWMVIRGIVYDCSSWGRFHPGGLESLMECAGRDGTELFDHYHKWVACDAILAPFVMGVFDPRVRDDIHHQPDEAKTTDERDADGAAAGATA